MNIFKDKFTLAAITLILLGAGLLLFVGLRLWRYRSHKSFQQICAHRSEEMLVMDDVYMRGFIEKGQKYRALCNWFDSHPFVRNDFVLYRYALKNAPVVRIIVAIPGDRFHVIKDKIHGTWNLQINGVTLKSGTRPYFFGGSMLPPLSLFEKSRHGIVGPHELIVLSSWPPGDLDSSLFGIISGNDVLAKAEPL